MDRHLDFDSNHPKATKCAVVRALTDRAKNVCSSPELLAEEMDHLGKVLKYNNYPKWMIDQCGRNNFPTGRLIDLETGNEVKKSIFILDPYFQGPSESFNYSNTHTFKLASRAKIPLNQCSCIPKTKSILLSKRTLSINGHALTQAANHHT